MHITVYMLLLYLSIDFVHFVNKNNNMLWCQQKRHTIYAEQKGRKLCNFNMVFCVKLCDSGKVQSLSHQREVALAEFAKLTHWQRILPFACLDCVAGHIVF